MSINIYEYKYKLRIFPSEHDFPNGTGKQTIPSIYVGQDLGISG